MIFLFLTDTGASMNQMASHGMTYLDCVKAAIEYFVKIRGNRGDSFHLVNCEEGLSAVKSWGAPVNEFLNEVKNLQAAHVSNIGPALKTSFDLLNLYRIQKSTDSYGFGRFTWMSDPAMIILLSNGKLNSYDGMISSLTLPLQPHQPGSDLTKEPFRWDQKLMSIVLRFPAYTQVATTKQYTTISGNHSDGPPLHPVSGETESGEPTALMSKVTGGKCFRVHAMKELLQCMELLHSRYAQPWGVVMNFEKFSGRYPTEGTLREDANLSAIPQSASHISVYRQNQSGLWPIPEAYVMDPAQPKLLPRSAQPLICFCPVQFDGFIPSNFPVDLYALERCALTEWMIKYRARSCWPVFVPGSSPKSNEPFGFLQVTNHDVTLYVLPFNFPRLWSLLDDVKNQMKMPSNKWRQEFDHYLSEIPSYYAQPLSKALKRFGLGINPIPEHMDGVLPYPVVNRLKNLKQQSKKECNRWVTAIKESSSSSAPALPSSAGAFFANTKSANKTNSRHEEKNKNEGSSALTLPDEAKPLFTVSRDQLIARVQRMRGHVFTSESHTHEEAKHNMPIGIMGNYQDVMMKRELMRDVNEDANKRPIFGNPYHKAGKPQERHVANNIIDEAETTDKMTDEVPVPKDTKPGSAPPSSSSGGSTGPRNPLIAAFFGDSAEPAPTPENQSSPPPKAGSPVEKNIAMPEEKDEDVKMIEEDQATPMDLFLAKQRIREHNLTKRNKLNHLLRGRKHPKEEHEIQQILQTLRGTQEEKRHLVQLLADRCQLLHKQQTASALRQYVRDHLS